MLIFAAPGQVYIRHSLKWVVDAIEGNLVRSKSVDHDIQDVEVLKVFNREVVAGLITFPDLSAEPSPGREELK